MTYRTSPLHQLHLNAGATLTDFAGWQLPVRYGSERAEHHAVRTSAGLFDLSHMAEILLEGPEASNALDYALVGAFANLPAGRAKYSLMLAPDGGVLDDLVVYRTAPERFLVVANAVNRGVVVRELTKRSGSFAATVSDDSDETALLAVQGPAALTILQRVPGLDVDGLAELRYYRCQPARFAGASMLVARTGYTGENGYELYLAPDRAAALWQAVVAAGSGLGLLPAGLSSRDTLRLEAGMPLYGHELRADIRPAQAGLSGVVNFADKAEFVGRAALEEDVTPDAAVLVGLIGDGRRAARSGYAITDVDGVKVGEVTSGALSPTLERPIAMGFVPPALATTGTPLRVDVRGTPFPVTVTELPFYTRSEKK